MSEFRKRRAFVALAVLLVAVVAVAVVADASDTQADDVQPRSDLSNLVSISATLNDDVTLYNSNTYNDLKVGNSGESDGLITVTGLFNDGGITSSRELEPEDYHFLDANDSDRLERGEHTITIRANSTGTIECVLEVTTLEDTLTTLSVTRTGTIYAGHSDSELEDVFVVRGVFENIGTDNDEIPYDVNWSGEPGDSVEFRFSATFNNRAVEVVEHYPVYEKRITSISVKPVETGLPDIYAGTDLDSLKSSFVVTATYVDGTTGQLGRNEYQISGDIFVLGTGQYERTLTFSVTGNSQVNVSFPVTVNAETVTTWYYNLDTSDFTALDNVQDIRDVLHLYVFTKTALNPVEISNRYCSILIGEDSSEFETLPEDDTDQLTVDDTAITVCFDLGDEISTRSASINVDYHLVSMPTFDEFTRNYVGTDSRELGNFDDDFMSIVNPSSGIRVDYSSANPMIITNSAGTYSFQVSLTNTNCRWDVRGGEPSADPLTFEWTILQANINRIIPVITGGGWVYDPEMVPSDIIELNVSTTGPSWTDEDERRVILQYYGTSADGKTSVGTAASPEILSDQSSLDAGTWWVRAHVDGTVGNWNEYTGDYVSFTVTKATVPDSAVTVGTRTYDGNEQTAPITISEAYHGMLSVDDSSGMAVDMYKATVAITPSYTNNYQWDNGTSEKQFDWTIERLGIDLPSLTYGESSGSSVEVPYSLGESSVTISYDSTWSRVSQATGLTLSGNTVTFTGLDVGRYVLTVSLDDTDNLEWSSGTSADTMDRTLTIFVVQADNSIESVTMSGWTYDLYDGHTPTVENALFGGDTVLFSFAENTGGDPSDGVYGPEYTLEQIGSNVPENAGSYWIRAHIAETSNYGEAYAYGTFTVAKAELVITGLGLDNWTYGETANSPSIDLSVPGSVNVIYGYAERIAGDWDGSDETYSGDVPQNAGLYWVRAYIAESDNYGEGYAYAQFEIYRAEIDVPTYSGTHTYNHGLEIAMGLSSTERFVVSGTVTATAAGTYHATVTPTDNYQWNDGNVDPTGPREVEWTVGKMTVVPQLTREVEHSDSPGWTWSPSGTITAEASFEDGTRVPVGFTVVGNPSQSDVGAYTITIEMDPQSYPNYQWGPGENGTGDDGQTLRDSIRGDEIDLWFRITLTTYNLVIDEDLGTWSFYYDVTRTFTARNLVTDECYGNLDPLVQSKIDGTEGTDWILRFYKMNDDGTYAGVEIDDVKELDVGQYRVQLVVLSTGTYSSSTSNVATFSVTEASMSVEEEVSASRIYHGEQGFDISDVFDGLLDPVASNGYLEFDPQIEYMYGSEGYVTDLNLWKVLRDSDRGVLSYTIGYRVTAENFATITGTVTFTINPAEILVTLKIQNVEYTGSTAVLDSEQGTDYVISGTVYGQDELGIKLTTAGVDVNPEGYAISVSWDNDNYTVTSSGDGRCYIQNAKMTVGNIADWTWTYSGAGQSVDDHVREIYGDDLGQLVTLVGTGNMPTIYFSSDGSSYSSELDLKDVGTGSYTIWFYVTAPNHEQSDIDSFTVTMNKANLTVTADDKEVTYGDAPPEFTISYGGFFGNDNESLFANGGPTVSCEYARGSDAGTYSIAFTNKPQLGNYNVRYVDGTLTVNQFKIEISFNDLTLDYDNRLVADGIPQTVTRDGTVHTIWTYSPANIPDNIDNVLTIGVIVDGSVTLDLPDAVFDGALEFGFILYDQNYIVSVVQKGDYSLTRSTISVSVNVPNSPQFDGTAKTATVTPADSVNVSYMYTTDTTVAGSTVWNEIDNGDLYGEGNRYLPVNAGTYLVVVEAKDDTNYEAVYTEVSYPILRGHYDLGDITLTDPNVQYDGNEHIPIIGGSYHDGADGSTPEPSFTEGQTDVGSRTVTVTFTGSDNYYTETRSCTVTVTHREVTVEWNVPSMVYGSADQSGIEATYESVARDRISLSVSLNGSDAFRDARDYTFTASFRSDDPLSGNYILSGDTTTVTIERLPVSIGIQNGEKAYFADPSVIITGLEGIIDEELRDDISWTCTSGRFDRLSPVDDYVLTPSYDTETFHNYTIKPTSGTIEVVPLRISVTVTGSTHSYTGYDQSLYPDGSQAASFTVSVIGGQGVEDDETVRSEIAELLNATLSFSTDSPDITRIDVGEYPVHIITANRNFDFPETAGTYVITAVGMGYVYGEGETYDSEYNGSGQSPFIPDLDDITFVGGKDVTDSVQWYFRSDQTSEWQSFDSSDPPTFTHVNESGTKYYKIEADNHNPYYFSFDVTIEQAENELLSYARDGWTYQDPASDTSLTLRFESEGVEPTFYYSKDGGEYQPGEPTDAGTYHVRVTYPGTDDYAALDVRFDADVDVLDDLTFVISPRPIDVPVWNYESFQYDGSLHENTLTYNQTIMRHGSARTDAEGGSIGVSSSQNGDKVTVTTSGTLSGNYYLEIEIVNGNYVWSDGEPTLREVHWSISSDTNRWEVGLTITGWTYGEYDSAVNSPSAVPLHGIVTYRYYHSDGTPVSDVSPDGFDAGDYYVIAFVEATPSYEGLEEVRSDFSVERATIGLVGDQITTYDPSQELQSFPDISYGEGVTVEVANGTHANAGTYEVTLTITDPNHKWSDGTLVANIEWTVERMEVPKPIEDNPGVDNVFQYSPGTVHKYVPDIEDGYETYIAISDDSQTEAGDYALVASLDFDNFRWESEANDAVSQPARLKWHIEPMTIPVPHLDEYSSTYTGERIDNPLSGYNRGIMWMRWYDASIDNSDSGPVLFAVDPGTYVTVIEIFNHNYVWDPQSVTDGESINGDLVTLTWTISGATVTWPSSWPDTEYTYNGEEQRFDFGTLDVDHVVITSYAQTDAGDYVISITPANGYSWSDGGAETRYVNWTIDPIEVTIVANDVTIVYGEVPILTWHYQGDGRFLASDGVVPTLRVDEDDLTPGQYDIMFDALNQRNYDVMTVSGTLTVTKAAVPVPDSVTVRFTGEPVQPSFPDGPYTVSTEPQTEVGDYTAVLTLNDPGCYAWEGTDEVSITVSWSIIGGREISWDDFDLDRLNGDEVYTGSEITKSVSSILRLNIDFLVTYENNIEVGTATGTIRGIGGFSGSLTFTFEIVKADPVISFAEDEITRYVGDGGFKNPLDAPSYVEEVRYSSSDTSVAMVDVDGNVTMVGVGHAVITAYVPGTENYNDSTAWFTVIVSSTPTVVIPGDDDVIVLPGPETVKWYQKDISLYILLIVILVVGFLLYIVYTVWKRRGDGQ